MSSPLSYFRRNQKLLLAIFGVLIMLTFVVGDYLMQYGGRSGGGRADEVVATWKHGKITENDLWRMRDAHNLTVRFLDSLIQKAIQNKGQPKDLNGYPIAAGRDPGIPRSYADEDLVQTVILARKAQDFGIRISDGAIDEFLSTLTDESVPRSEFGSALSEASQGRLDRSQLFDQLRTELAAQHVRMMARSGVFALSPSLAWDGFNRLNRRVKAEFLPLAVADFESRVTGQPTDAQIRQLFDEGKDRFPSPDSPEAGFKRRPKIAFGYLKAEFEKFLQAEMATVTPEQIAEHYEKNKNDYKLPETPDAPPADAAAAGAAAPGEAAPSAGPALDAPANAESEAMTGPAESTESSPSEAAPPAPGDAPAAEKPPTEKPAAEKPADEKPDAEKPADEKPAGEKPAAEKPAAEKPAAEKPDAEKPAAEKPAGDAPGVDDMDKPDSAPPAAPRQDGEPSKQSRREQRSARPAMMFVSYPGEPVAASADMPSDASPAPAPAADSPAVAPPAAETPDEKTSASSPDAATPPAAAPPAAEGAASQAPAARYRPLVEVEAEIRRELARAPAQDKMTAALKAARAEVDKYFRAYTTWRSRAKEQAEGQAPTTTAAGEAPVLDVEGLAKQYGLTAGQTPLVDELEIGEYELGKAFRFSLANNQFRRESFAEIAFNSRQPLFKSDQIRSFEVDVEFLYWKTEEKEDSVPTLAEARDEVVAAWRRDNAFQLAQTEAERQAKALPGDKPLRESAPEGQGQNVLEPPEFTWLTRGALPTGSGAPMLSTIDGIEYAGPEFMQTVFALQPNTIGVAANSPRTVVYIVRLVSESPDEETRRTQFMETGLTGEMAFPAQIELWTFIGEWYRELERDMQLSWRRPPQAMRWMD